MTIVRSKRHTTLDVVPDRNFGLNLPIRVAQQAGFRDDLVGTLSDAHTIVDE